MTALRRQGRNNVGDEAGTGSTDTRTEPRVHPTFDYVIVGAGPSAMGLLYGLLQRLEQRQELDEEVTAHISIAIIERGSRQSHPSTRYLENWYAAAHTKVTNHDFSKSVQHYETTLTGRTMDLPVGRGLGGTSNINAGLLLPPLRDDLEAWPEPWRSSLHSAISSIQDRLKQNGALHVRNATQTENYSDLPLEWDTKVTTMESFPPSTEESIFLPSSPRLARTTYYDGLVAPFLTMATQSPRKVLPKVDWILDTQVQHLLIAKDTRQIYGVECYSASNKTSRGYSNFPKIRIYCRRAVILCSGAIETPVLLLRSDIGPDCEYPLPGVGHHLKDQLLVPRTFWTPPWRRPSSACPLSTNGIAAIGHIQVCVSKGKDSLNHPQKKIFQVAIVDLTAHATILPSSLAMVVRRRCLKSKFTSTVLEMTFQSIKWLLWFLIAWTPLGSILRHCTTTVLLFLMHPESEGCISIETSSTVINNSISTTDQECEVSRSDVSVNVDIGYLQHPNDVQALQAAWESLASPGSWRMEIFPRWAFPSVIWGKYWFQWFCRGFSQPYFHFAGTCAMPRSDQQKTETSSISNEDDWVVDSHLQLRGHQGLFVCDASVFPTMVSSPPALTCCALGYEFSKVLLSKSKGKTKSH